MALAALVSTQITPGEINTVSKAITEYGVMTVGIAILFLIVIGLFGFFVIQYNRMAKNFDTLIKKLTQKDNDTEASNEIERDIVNFHMFVNTTMRDHLRMFRDTVDCDRTFVFTFHNNEHSITGFPYLKASCHIEYSLWNLEHNIIADQKDIQSSALIPLTMNLMNPGSFLCHDIEMLREEDPMFYGWLRRIASKSFFARALVDSRGRLIGFVGCDSMTEQIPEERVIQINEELAVVASAISAILDIQNKIDRRANRAPHE